MGVTCTCTVFARTGKLHRPDCPKHKTYAQHKHEQTITRKAGKKERMKTLLNELRPDEPTPMDEDLKKVLTVEQPTQRRTCK